MVLIGFAEFLFRIFVNLSNNMMLHFGVIGGKINNSAKE
jgi:hypothetical protein